MGRVCDDYPARIDANGRTWYRAGTGPQDGWTANIEFAHPSYRDADAPAPVDSVDGSGPSLTSVEREVPTCPYGDHSLELCGAANAEDHGLADPFGPVDSIDEPQPPFPPPGRESSAATQREDEMTAIDMDGVVETTPARTTKTMGYPLPPEPPRVKIVYDGWGRYKLPSPTTGRPTAFSRSTTIADTLDDTYNLSRWKRRETAAHVLSALSGAPKVAPLVEGTPNEAVKALKDAYAAEDKGWIDRCLDHIDLMYGGADARELGEAVHAWLEAIDIGLVSPADLPNLFKPYWEAYHGVLQRFALTPVPTYVERIVLNDRGEETVAGTLDRIYRCIETGELYLGDLKTSKTLDFSWLTYGVQLAVYGWSTLMLSLDGTAWEPMPEINQDCALIIHVPSDQPERADLVTMDLVEGGGGMVSSLEVRRRRREAKKTIPFKHAVPPPSEAALRHVTAHYALLNTLHADVLIDVAGQYQDVWNDDLNRLAAQCYELLTANAPANATTEGK